MDFYEEASLVMVPSGYKDQKVYSSVPDDGSGDLTFSRASNATRVGPDGLIEKVRTNLAWPSADFTTNWVSNNGSVTANTTANPIDGAVTADTFTATAAAGSRVGFEKNFTSQTGDVTASTYFKYTNNQWVFLAIYDTNNAIYRTAAFDIQNGVVGVKSSGVTSTITSVGGGFYRCLLTFPIATSTNIYHSQGILNSNVTGVTSTTSGGESFIAFGAQLEASDIVTDYIATTTAAVSVGPVANVPRLDYLDSSSPRLLLEPQRTNLVANSENTSGYSTFGSAFTQNTATSPQGYVNADTMAGDGSQIQIFASTPITFASAGQVTVSFFAKANNANAVSILMDGFAGVSPNTAIFDLTNGTTASSGAKIENYENGWYRCSFTSTIDAGDLSGSFAFNVRPNVASLFWPTAGDANGKSVFIWGFQAEAGAYATSYIPTLGAAVTRVQDQAEKASISSLIGATEGTMFVDILFTGDADNSPAYIQTWASQTERLGLFYSNSTNLIRPYLVSSGQTDFSLGFTPTAGTRYKMAFCYKANDYAFFVNGSQVTIDTKAAVPTAGTKLFVGCLDSAAQANRQFSNINQALLFQTRLSNADLATLTTL